MDPPDGWNLRPVAEPVSYFDTGTRQWTSGSFDTAMKSEHPAVVTSSDTPAAASSAFAAAAQHGSASTPAHVPWNGMHRTSGHMPTPSRQQRWLNAVAWADTNPDVGAPLAEDRDDAADGGYNRQVMPNSMPTPQATPPPYQPSMQASCSMRWPLPDQGAPPCMRGRSYAPLRWSACLRKQAGSDGNIC